MKAVIFISSIVALLTLTQVSAAPAAGVVSGFQCVGINIEGLHLSQDDLRTGAGFPSILDAPREGAKNSERRFYDNLYRVAACRGKWIPEGNGLWR